MPTEIGLWQVDGKPVRLAGERMPSEERLEELIEADPDILGQPLLIIGRQVRTSFAKIVDLLAVGGDGVVHVLELKRDRTPRDVVAQALDYGSWVHSLDRTAIEEIFDKHTKDHSTNLVDAFTTRFGYPPPDALNERHRLTIIAASMDDTTERIVAYLGEHHQVPINVVFFQYFENAGRRYLARTWLLPEDPFDEPTAIVTQRAELWNRRDWYVSFGHTEGQRDWGDAQRWGFVSAGGGDWYVRSLRKLPLDARVFVYVPRVGYVGVGIVTGDAQPFADARLAGDPPERLADKQLNASYEHDAGHEWIVPVRWLQTRPLSDAVKAPKLYANQNSATKLRDSYTLQYLTAAFGLGS